MAAYRAFKKSEQRELAQQIAADLNDGITRERHAEIAATVLTSDWLAAHDAAVEAAVRADMAPKVVSTVEELIALPIGTWIGVDIKGIFLAYCKFPSGWRGLHGQPTWTLDHFPATVLWVPVTPDVECPHDAAMRRTETGQWRCLLCGAEPVPEPVPVTPGGTK